MTDKDKGKKALLRFHTSVNTIWKECGIDVSLSDIPSRKPLTKIVEKLTNDYDVYAYINEFCDNQDILLENIQSIKRQLWAVKQVAQRAGNTQKGMEDKESELNKCPQKLLDDAEEKDAILAREQHCEQIQTEIFETINNLITMRDKLDMRWDFIKQEEPDNETALKVIESQQKNITLILRKSGVETLDTLGKFDPSYQTVVKTVCTEDESLIEQIAETFRPGYRYHGKLLRTQEVVLFERKN